MISLRSKIFIYHIFPHCEYLTKYMSKEFLTV